MLVVRQNHVILLLSNKQTLPSLTCLTDFDRSDGVQDYIYSLWSKWRGNSSMNCVSRAQGSHSRMGTWLAITSTAFWTGRGSSWTPARTWNISHVGQWASSLAWTANTCRRGTVDVQQLCISWVFKEKLLFTR